MRVFMTTDAVGGVWHYSVALAAELARGGCGVRLGVIGPGPSPAQAAEAARAGVELVAVGAPLDWLAGSAAALRAGRVAIAEAARGWRADIVQVNQPAYAPGRHPAPVVAVAHSCVETWWRGTHGRPAPADDAWHRDAVRDGLNRAGVAVAPSRSFAEMLRAAYGLAAPPLAVLNGVAPGAAVAGPKGEFVLASGRVWDSSKNFQLLEAAARSIGWPVRLAGEGVAPDGTNALVLRNVRCLGQLRRAAMAREYAAAPVYVSPSLHEPFGLGVLEAAQAGAALVLADIPTFRELWQGAALFFGRRDAGGLAAAVNRLIGDAEERQRLANAAAARAARYTIARTAHGMRAAYGLARQASERVPA